ncbi:hypothetical protein M9458_029518, partial [Cirrhinus mrigala]
SAHGGDTGPLGGRGPHSKTKKQCLIKSFQNKEFPCPYVSWPDQLGQLCFSRQQSQDP